MTKKQAIRKSIEHWERMIKWARKRLEDDTASTYIMMNEIGEKWWGDWCMLCKKYGSSENGNCTKCPLAQKIGKFGGCTESWCNTTSSETWGEWVKNAKVMLKDLKSLEVSK